jgi:peptide/nickel transport system ATP-binding protein
LCVTFKKALHAGSRVVNAVNGVSLELGEGESVGLVGESGSGKTAVSRMIVGLESVTGGEISIAGLQASKWHALLRRDRRLLRSTVQIVFQDPTRA